MPTRIAWIDSARGIGIILVVLGHGIRGLDTAGLLTPDSPLLALDRWIYSFHMPLFFLLSGMFADFALRPIPVGTAITERVWRLLYPLALWTYLFLGFRLLAGAAANHPVSPADLLIIPLPPRDHFWFLWALFLIQVVALLTAHLLKRTPRPGLFWSSLLLTSVLLSALIQAISLPSGFYAWWAGAIRNAPFFFLGAAAAPLIRSLTANWATPLFGVVLLCLGSVAALSISADGNSSDMVALALSGSVLLCCVSLHAIPRCSPLLDMLGTLGRMALAIYLAHTIFSAATRILLLRTGIEAVPLHLVAGLLAGLIGPYILYRLATRLGLLRILGLA